MSLKKEGTLWDVDDVLDAVASVLTDAARSTQRKNQPTIGDLKVVDVGPVWP